MNKTFRFGLEALAVSLACLFYALHLRPEAHFRTYLARDLDRAYQLLQGHAIFYGPELSGGGHLPGGFYYLLMSLPLALGLGWKGVFLLHSLLNGLAAGLLWISMRLHVGFAAAVCAVASYTFSCGLFIATTYFGNPSFLPFFTMVSLLGVWQLQRPSTSNRTLICALTFFAMGLGVQIHYCMLLVLATACFLLLAPGAQTRLSRREMVWAGCAFVIPLLPYLIWSALDSMGFGFGQPELPFTGQFADAPTSLKEMSTVRGAFKLTPAQFGRRTLDLLFPAPVLAVLSGLLWVTSFSRAPAVYNRMPVALIAVALVCLSLPGLNLAKSRYMIPSCVPAALFAAWAFGRVRAYGHVWLQRGVASLCALAAMGPVAKWLVDPYCLSIAEMTAITRAVRGATGWNYDEAKYRLYFIGSYASLTLRYVYEQEEDANRDTDAHQARPDGFFVVLTQAHEKPPGRDDIAKEVPPPVAKAIKQGGLLVGPAQPISTRVSLFSYKIISSFHLPVRLHNRAEEYYTDQPRIIDDVLAKDPRFSFSAVFNSCPDRAEFCRILLNAQSRDFSDPTQEIRVQILGLPLSFPSRWVSVRWTESIAKPYLQARCDGRTVHVQLATLIGAGRGKHGPGRAQVFLAPFERRIRLPCRGRVEALRLGFIRSYGFQFPSRLVQEGSYQDFQALTASAN
ncbi:MAG: hypothetical protein AB7G93_16940 [Bdellovibrionales bacterium]